MPELALQQVVTGPQLGLSFGLSDLLVIEIGGRTVLYGLSRTEGRLVELTVAPDGSLTVAGSLALTGAFAAGSEPLLGFVDGAAGPKLLLAGMPPASGAFVSLDGDGSLVAQSADTDVGQMVAPLSLDLALGTAILSGRAGTGGLDLYLDTILGPVWASGLADTSSTYLADISASASFELAGTSYVITASVTEDGVTLVGIGPTGGLSALSALGAANGLPVNDPSDLAVIQRSGETLVVVGASGTSSLSVLEADAAGGLWLTDHILDSTATRFQSTTAIDAVTAGDFAYVVAGGADGGVSLYTVLPGGRLVHLSTIADDATMSLYRVSAVSLEVSGAALQIYASSAWEAGITRLSYDLTTLGAVLIGTGSALAGTAADDQLVGSDEAEALDGGAGDDILFDGQGSDTMTGGAGADLFIFAQDGVPDTVLDYEPGTDRLDLSGFDFLHSAAQLAVTPTSDGAVIVYAGETIVIHSASGAPLSAGDFPTADILDSDRPSMQVLHQVLTGGAGADVLNGGIGNDTIEGLGGNDLIRGGGGADWLSGGDGHDEIRGGDGDDQIDGGTGLDTIEGGAGDDQINGGAGADVIWGDEIA